MSQTLVVHHLRAQGLEEGDEHPPMLSCGAWLTLPLPYPLCTVLTSEFCNAESSQKLRMMSLSDSKTIWWDVQTFRHNAGVWQTDRVLVSISRIVKSRRESRGCDFITTTVLNLHSYTKACYFEPSLLQELTRPVPFNDDGAQSFSLLNKAMLIIFWVISAYCLQCFDSK